MHKLDTVASSHGAPMGRPGSHPGNEPEALVSLQRVRLDSGGYDSAGAYWGHGRPLYWATDGQPNGFERFFRASSRDAAKAKMREGYPDIRFYR